MHKQKISNEILRNLNEINPLGVDFSFIYQIYCDELFQCNIQDNLQINYMSPLDGEKTLRLNHLSRLENMLMLNNLLSNLLI
jgi:hypothetical protein